MVPIREAPLQFLEVAVNVTGVHLVERADEGSDLMPSTMLA